jgi:hypothetical protein
MPRITLVMQQIGGVRLMKSTLRLSFIALAALACAAMMSPVSFAAAVPKIADGLSGSVTSAKGPEAGVWVIAETSDLPSRYIKIVVTDDQGRYVLPQLPKAKYKVWVRGFGLVDSNPVDATPGNVVDLKAVVAPSPKEAAQYYPPNYWFAMIHAPKADEFPGTGPKGNGIGLTMRTQQEWMHHLKGSCQLCHQLGDKATRETPDPTVAGWMQRIQMARPANDQAIGNHGPAAAAQMMQFMSMFGPRGPEMFSDWTTRIANGEIPKEVPPRPQGKERNVVLTLRDWGNNRFMHDLVATDRRNPTLNANGPIYGAGNWSGTLQQFDPIKNENTEIGYSIDLHGKASLKHDIDAYPHNPMLDQKGRLWATDIGRSYLPPLPADAPKPDRAAYCTDASNKYAAYFPLARPQTSAAVVYDPATKKIDAVPTCFDIHHLTFGRDPDNTLYFSGDMEVVGWIDTKVWDETHDAAKAQGWCPIVVDSKDKALADASGATITPDRKQWSQPAGFGVMTGGDQAESGQSAAKAAQADANKDTRVMGFNYGIDENPKDGSIWTAMLQGFPDGIIRFERGANAPLTCKSEYFQPPKKADGTYAAWGARGIAVDTNGLVWVAFGSGQWGSFDRSKCKNLRGPAAATGQQCPEGWKIYDVPGPRMTNAPDTAADWYYLVWTDQYNTFGLGANTPIAPGSGSDSLIAFDRATQKTLRFQVPYPAGFYSRGVDGRIDDAKAGWKGRGLWASFSDIPVWHQEDGFDHGPELVQFQLRPDPLAH